MRIIRTRLKAALAAIAAVAVVGVAVPAANPVNAQPPGTPSFSGITLSPSTGNSGTSFSLAFSSAPQVCPGDATANYRWSTFITPLSNDPADMIYSASGTPVAAEPQFSNNLADSIGVRVRAQNPGLGDGLVVAPTGLTFGSAVFAGLPAGAYNVGIACTLPDASNVVQTERFWSVGVTITAASGAGPNNFNYAVGVAPAAPNLTAANAGNQTCSAVFTPGSGGATSFTATANPGGLTGTGAGSPLTIGGLTNGVTYSVSVTGTNTVGTSPASNSLNCTPVAGPRTNVTAVIVTPGAPGSGNATVSWTLPGANVPAATPTGYQVVITGPTPSTQTVADPGTSLALTTLAVGSYTAAVTAQYADPPTTGTVPPTAAVPFAVSPSSVIMQDIDVVRPVGALVMTQVCNSNGSFTAEAASFGFPGGIPAVSAANSSTVVSPTAGGLEPTLHEDGVRPGDNDPNRGEYPYPTNASGVANPTYPTHCGIDLGIASFVTRGNAAGQFFATTGVIDQITIVDTTDADTGWSVSGTMSNFSANGGTDTFSGSQLGWKPKVTDYTAPWTDALGNTYTQQPLAGAIVDPNTPSGLGAGKTLMTAASGHGLGVAIADAQLKLLIPVTADAGTYQGTLTLSATSA